MEQKYHILIFFGLKLTIFFTWEGCSGPKNDYFGQNCAFWAQKGPFLGLITLLRPTRTFLVQKMAIYGKIYFFSEENYQERLLLMKIGPF
jgi:hypothetical protein